MVVRGVSHHDESPSPNLTESQWVWNLRLLLSLGTFVPIAFSSLLGCCVRTAGLLCGSLEALLLLLQPHWWRFVACLCLPC